MRQNNDGYLDRIRIAEGIDRCKAAFNAAAAANIGNAAALLNDRRVTYPCLYSLLPEITTNNIGRYLNTYNKTAVEITNQILNPDTYPNDILSVQSKTAYSVLKWIVGTGFAEDGLDNDYEQVLDTAAAVLINTYKDASVLAPAADMLFKRHKRGAYTHDLVWSLFQARHPNTLKLIAQHLLSTDKGEVGLACKLLNIEELESAADHKRVYEAYQEWLKENDPFLYFTDENFQFSSDPVFCRVDMERKYLARGTPAYSHQPYVAANDVEKKCLEAFRTLGDEDKKILSDYSYKMYNANAPEWRKWLVTPVERQVFNAKSGSGVLV